MAHNEYISVPLSLGNIEQAAEDIYELVIACPKPRKGKKVPSFAKADKKTRTLVMAIALEAARSLHRSSGQ